MLRSIARNFSIVTLARLVEGAITLFFVAFVARKLGPELFGTYVFVMSTVVFASILFNVGITPIAFREIARERDNPRPQFERIFSLRIVLGVVAYLVMVTVVWLLDYPTQIVAFLAVIGLSLIVDAAKESFSAFHTAFERLEFPSLFQLGLTVFGATAAIVALHAGSGLLGLLVALVSVNVLVAVVWGAVFIQRFLSFSFRVNVREWGRFLKLVVPFAPIHAANETNNVLNPLLLSKVSGPVPETEAIGYFGPAKTLANIPVVLLVGVRRALIPAMAARLAKGDAVGMEFEAVMKAGVAFLCAPFVLVTTFFSVELIELVFGPDYRQSAPVLVILGWASAAQVIAMLLESLLFTDREQGFRRFIPGSVASVTINLLLSLVLIPVMSFMGAAVGLLVSRVIYLAFVLRYCRRHVTGVALRIDGYWDVLAFTALILAIGYLTRVYIEGPWLRAGIIFSAYIVLTSALLALRRSFLKRVLTP